MNKAKKILSMILALTMVLTVVPAAAPAFAANEPVNVPVPPYEGGPAVPDGCAYGAVTVTPPPDFTADTSETTEVIRVAEKENSMWPGDEIVKATPSGVPYMTGAFVHIAYQGEAPVFPFVKCKITCDIEPTDVTCVADASGVTCTAQTTTTTGNARLYSWQVGGSVSAGTDVVFTITYSINGVQYTSYAFSRAEEILRPGGYVNGMKCHIGNTSNDCMMTPVGQFKSRNMYASLVNVSSNAVATPPAGSLEGAVGFVDYVTGGPKDGEHDWYGGCDPTTHKMHWAGDAQNTSPAYVRAITDEGNPRYDSRLCVIEKTHVEASKANNVAGDPQFFRFNANYTSETYRSLLSIYQDKRDEVLGAGSGGKKGLNFRSSMHMGSWSQLKDSNPAYGPCGNGIYMCDGRGINVKTESDTMRKLSEVTLSYNAWNLRGKTDPNVLDIDQPFGGPMRATQDGTAVWYNTFKGNGPALRAADAGGDIRYEYSLICDNFAQRWTTKGWGGKNWFGVASASVVLLDLHVYDTTDLKNLLDGIDAGDGSAVTLDGTRLGYTGEPWGGGSVVFNKGKHPQANLYTSDTWTPFINAYRAARSVMVKPNTNQGEINRTVTALATAYNGLQKGNDPVNVKIKYVDRETDEEILPSLPWTGYHEDDFAGAAFSTVTASAATINGYDVETAEAVKTVSLDPSAPTKEIVFHYNPKSYDLYAFSEGFESSPLMTSRQYNRDVTVDFNALSPGTKAGYSCKGWYVQNGWTSPDGTVYNPGDALYLQGASDSGRFKMPACRAEIVAVWSPNPIDVWMIPVDCGTPLERVRLASAVFGEGETTVEYGRPAAPTIEGKEFINFYTDEACTVLAEFPRTFNAGDPAWTLYGRYEVVTHRILFDSRGGTQVAAIDNITAGQVVPAPAPPTRTGYDFVGWKTESAAYGGAPGSPVSVFGEDGLGTQTIDAYGSGFTAYAEWTPKTINVRFDLKNPNPDPIFDTASVAEQNVAVDACATEPAAPYRFGYSFKFWTRDSQASLSSAPFDFSAPIPAEDYENNTFTLYAVWSRDLYSASIKLDPFEKRPGEAIPLPDADANGKFDAARGQIVTFRMISKTNFWNGSCAFVFMYDNKFFEPVPMNGNTLVLNPDNDYVAGFHAERMGVEAVPSANYPSDIPYNPDLTAMAVFVDPGTGAEVNPNTGLPWTQRMEDGSWLIEFNLKIKSEEGSPAEGRVFMNPAWTSVRPEDLKPMFYAADANATRRDISSTNRYAAVPDVRQCSVENPVWVEIPANAPTLTQREVTLDPNTGLWSDTSSTPKTFTGNESTLIPDYEAPEKDGYHIAAWINPEDSTDVWTEGYYPDAGHDRRTYKAQWEGNPQPVKFYADGGKYQNDSTVYEISVLTGANIELPETDYPTREGYRLVGWKTADNSPVPGEAPNFDFGTAPVGGTSFTAVWAANTDTPFKIIVKIPTPNNWRELIYAPNAQIQNYKWDAYKGTTGYAIHIVESIPETPEENVLYLTYDQLPGGTNGPALPGTNANYIFDPDLIENLPTSHPENANYGQLLTQTIEANGEGQVYVYYKGKDITYRFNPDGGIGGTWDDAVGGNVPIDITGPYSTVCNPPQVRPDNPHRPYKYGYDFSKWNGYPTDGKFKPMPDCAVAGETDTYQFNAAFTAHTYDIKFYAAGGAYDNQPDAPGLAVVTSTFGSCFITPDPLPKRAGFVFEGWTTVPDDPNDPNAPSLPKTPEDIQAGIDNATIIRDADLKIKPVDVDYDESTNPQPTYYAVWSKRDIRLKYVKVALDRNNLQTETETELISEVMDPLTYYYGETVTINEPETTPAGYARYPDENAHWALVNGGNLIELAPAPGSAPGTPATLVIGPELDSLLLAATGNDPVVLTVKLRFVAAEVEVTFDANGGSFGENVTTTTVNTFFHELVYTPDILPTRLGYTFAGWNSRAAWDEEPGSNLLIDAPNTALERLENVNQNYRAIWTPRELSYTVVVKLQNADDDEYTDLNSLTRSGAAGSTVNYVDIQSDVERILGNALDEFVLAPGEYSVELTPVTDDASNATLEVRYNRKTYKLNTTTNIVPSPPEFDHEYWYRYGQSIVAEDLIVPSVPGYTFVGWEPAVPATMPSGELQLTAKMDAISYPYRFLKEKTDETPYARGSLPYNTGIDKPSDPTKTGYDFAYWRYYNDEGTPPTDVYGNNVPKVKIVADANNPVENTFVACWTIRQFTVTYYKDAARTAEAYSTQVYYGEAIPDCPEANRPEQEGYHFDSWTCDDYPELAPGSNMPDGDVKFIPNFEPNTYTVTFLPNGGAYAEGADPSAEMAYGTAIPTPDITATNGKLTRTGYTFKGWTKTSDPPTGAPTLTDLGTVAVDGNTFYAVWAAADVVYHVEVHLADLDGNRPVAPNADLIKTFEFHAATESIVTYDAVRDEVELRIKGDGQDVGFAFNSVDTSLPPEGLTVLPDGSATMIVYYDRLQKRVTFDPNDGTYAADADPSGNVYYQADIPTPDITADNGKLTKTGYTFGGWSTAIGGEPLTNLGKMENPFGDKTFYAVWEAADVVYHVEVHLADLDGNRPVAPNADLIKTFDFQAATGSTVHYDAVRERVELQIKGDGQDVGFVFNSVDPSGGLEVLPDGSATMIVYYDRLQKRVTFDPNGGTYAAGADPSGNVYYQADIPTPVFANVDALTKQGYTFNGWSTAIGGEPLTNLGKMENPFGDKTFYAVWEANSDTVFKIVIKYDDALTPDVETLTVTLNFTGTTGNAVEIVNSAGTDPNTKYVLKSEIEANKGEALTHYELDNSRPEYFTGHTIAADGTTELSVYYIPKVYTATFDTNLASGPQQDEPISYNVAYGSFIEAPPDPTKTGYTFKGWKASDAPPDSGASFKRDADGYLETIAEQTTVKMLNAGESYNAVWEQTEYRLTFLDADGVVIDALTRTLHFGDAFTVPAAGDADAPVKEFWELEYWVDNNSNVRITDFTMPADNLTLSPHFKRIPVHLDPDPGLDVYIEDPATGEVDDVAPDDPNVTPPDQMDPNKYPLPRVYYVSGFAVTDADGRQVGLAESAVKPAPPAASTAYFNLEGQYSMEVEYVNDFYASKKICGTGTRLLIFDEYEGHQLVEIYNIVIFGDLNGDARVAVCDTTALEDEAYAVAETPADAWSKATLNISTATDAEKKLYQLKRARFFAGDLNHSGVIDAADFAATERVTRRIDPAPDQKQGIGITAN